MIFKSFQAKAYPRLILNMKKSVTLLYITNTEHIEKRQRYCDFFYLVRLEKSKKYKLRRRNVPELFTSYFYGLLQCMA